MKLERLRALLERQGRLKVYVLTRDMALCGYASAPFASAVGLRVAIDASVRLVLGTGEVIHDSVRTGTVFLTEGDRVTRRLQTHRRHLVGTDVPPEYLRSAEAL